MYHYHYWPWWLGAVALAGVTIGFWLLLRRPLGVSGSWARVLQWRDERTLQRQEAGVRADAKGMQDALLAATLAQFGETATRVTLGAGTPTAQARAMSTPVPWTAHLTFLLALVGGGVLAGVATDSLHWHFTMGATFARFFGDGWSMTLWLFGGGVLVGFGTQMAGGCSSGHGLSGCANLLGASLIATASFFATAVAVSFILEMYS